MERREQICNALLTAAEKGFTSLFAQHPEHFYYCALISMECASPCIAAISEESLEQVLSENYADETEKSENLLYYKWSYADSPYLGFGYEAYFGEVNALFNQDVWDDTIDDDECDRRFLDWLEIMCDVMEELKRKGIFSSSTFLNAEQQPPEDPGNAERARRLNDDAVFSQWYEDNREEYAFEEE